MAAGENKSMHANLTLFHVVWGVRAWGAVSATLGTKAKDWLIRTVRIVHAKKKGGGVFFG